MWASERSPVNPIPIGILGATGMVGQRMVSLLAGHPWFQIAYVAASQRSAGRTYAEATRWLLPGEPPPEVARMPVRACDPDQLPGGVRIVLSALDRAVAGPVEEIFRDLGCAVITNAGNHRMDPDVPLIIPEVNAHHLSLVDERSSKGFIVANPNCCAIPLAMALAPLHRRWPVEAVLCATWQAASGAGYPGEASWDLLDTVHPHAGDEEDKLTQEPQKILGFPGVPLSFPVSARCVRVPVSDGHLIGLSARLRGNPDPDDVAEALRTWEGWGPPLPSCPRPPLRVLAGRDRPNTRQDRDTGRGMVVSIGRVERCPILGVKLYALGHNTIRGAAGAAIANAELIVATDRVPG